MTAPPPAPENLTGGQAVVRALEAEGVTDVFGIISIHMLPIYDAILHSSKLRLRIPRHEMAGGFMADAYARVSGKVGVYLTSTGPGAANSMGAVIESWAAASRTIQLTSQIPSHLLHKGRGMLHEVKDQEGMFAATGAHVAHVPKTEAIPAEVHRLFHNLRAGRAVPQVLEIPIDKQYGRAKVEVGEPMPVVPVEPPDEALERAARLLAQAKRPVLWLGGGVNLGGAWEEARQLAEILGAAVFMTRGGRGALSDDHPQAIGNYFGEKPARTYISESDAIVAVGTKFSWHSTSEWNIKIPENLIRIDLDVHQLHHNYPAAVAIHSDAGPAMIGLAEKLAALNHRPLPAALEAAAALKAELRDEIRKHRPMTTALMDAIDANSPRDKVLVTDATIPAYWGGNQYLPVRSPRSFVTPKLAAIGPGYPMALGAQAVDPDRPVLCIAGDGGFQFHTGELATAVQEKLPVVLLIFNNRSYGVLKRIQEKMMGGRIFGVDLHTPDFAKVAEAHGVRGEVATTPEELGAKVKAAFDARVPCLIDVQAPFEP